MGLLTTPAHHAAVRDMERQVWPAPADWHPTRAQLPPPPPREPVPQPVLLDFETVCIRLEREQHTAIRRGVLKLEDAPWMPCECDECWRLFDATEADNGELGGDPPAAEGE